jgi:hypothetical protein
MLALMLLLCVLILVVVLVAQRELAAGGTVRIAALYLQPLPGTKPTELTLTGNSR